MKVSIYTQIFPRLETFFLEEWIKHNISIGVDEIFIYDNGLESKRSSTEIDCKIPIKYEGMRWAKKPDADYFDEYSDEQIYEHLYKVVDKYPSVKLIKWYPQSQCPFEERILCQCKGYLNCLNNNDRNSWWIHIDPDEFLFSKKFNLKELIEYYENKKVFSLKLTQRVFEERKRNVPIKNLIKYGYDIDICKCIVKSPKLNSTMDLSKKVIRNKFIHDVESTLGNSQIIPVEHFRFNHYRSQANSGNMHTKNCASKLEFNKIDKNFKYFRSI